MSMTMTQKIIAAHCGKDEVKAGEMVLADVDIVLANDITAPVSISEFEKHGFIKVFDREKIALVMDHFVPCKDMPNAIRIIGTAELPIMLIGSFAQ